jgi:peptidoglycan-N-acetylglucosamine deacetylase
MKLRLLFTIVSIIVLTTIAIAQTAGRNWNGRKCAVVLTYDDALNIHLDKVIPELNSFGFTGTFYLIGASPVVTNRRNEWRAASEKGHELGNHSLRHPCLGSLPGRDFVKPETDLNNYSVQQAISEIRQANTILNTIDGKQSRTFAYPCGDLKIRDTFFFDSLKNEFAGARGVMPGYLQSRDVNLSDINAFSHSGTTSAEMIAQVEEAEKRGSFVVFLFHGVGGEHPLNIDAGEHSKLLQYLKKKEKDIWIAPMVTVASQILIRNSQSIHK